MPLVAARARPRAPRASTRARAAAQLAAAGADVFVAALVADARLVGARARSTTTAGSALGEHLRELAELVAGRRPRRSCCTRTSARWSRRAADVERRSRTPTCRWCFDTGHLLIGGVDPAAFVRDHAERIVPRPPQGRRRARSRRASAPASCRSSQATQAGLFRPLGRGRRADRRGRRRCSTQTGYERWLVLEQDTAITGRSPRSAAVRSSMCAGASSSCPHWLRGERGCHSDEATARQAARWPSSSLAALVAAGCGGNDKDDERQRHARPSGSTRRTVNLTQGSGLTFAMVTHSDEGSFWSVVKKGAEQAAKDEGVKLIWSPSNNDPQKQAQLIDAAVSQKVDGLAVSVPNADAIKGSLAKAKAAGIPIITLNSGADDFKALGAITHVGQTETIAGEAAGRAAQGRRRQEGALRHPRAEQHRPPAALRRRQEGLRRRRSTNLQVKGTADIATTQTEIKSKLQADKSFDARHHAEPGHRRRRRDARSRARARTRSSRRSTSARPSSRTSRPGNVEFAVDQQQYLQGYLPIVFLKLFKHERQHGRRRPAGAHRARASSTRPTPRRSRSSPRQGTR